MKSAHGPLARNYTQTVRAEAAAQTGDRIANAFLGRLMTQWFDEITLDLVAADAGVTVQTVIRRFGGKEGLLREAVKTLGSQIISGREMPVGEVEKLVNKLYEDYEVTGDAVIRLLALEARHASLKAFLDIGRNGHRQWIAGVMADDIRRVRHSLREKFVDALVIVTDVYAWKLLRRDMGRSLPAAVATTQGMVRATIREFTQNSSMKGR